MIKSNKRTKRVLLGVAATLLVSVLVLTGVGVFFAVKDKKVETSVNPLSWSVDTWDGASIGSEEYLADYGNRGEKTITIESASSFMYFINQVNTGNDYKGYTVYLNSNIDLNGNSIDSIGNIDRPFRGVFDGSYYTIMNANVNGNGLFGSTEGAVIKNLGVYNVNVNFEGKYVGGLIGEAHNTSIKNSFVRLGSVKGAKFVGGLVGLMSSEDGVNSILSCFTDTVIKGENIGGLVGKIKTMDSGEALTTIQESYFTTCESAYASVDNPSYFISNMLRRVTSVKDFVSWNYNKDINAGAKWTNYAFAKNSTELSFNYPILSEFVKVYTKGACYENVVYNAQTGKSENVASLSEAVAIASKLDNAQINIIVNEVTVDDTVELSDGASLKINATKDTTIIKGENVENLFVGTNNSNIVIGSETGDAKIVLDGNSGKNANSGALIKTNGSNVTIHKNVVLQNNVNNSVDSKGGAIYVSNDLATPLSTDYKNITIHKDVTITNCSAEMGGAIYVEGNVNLSIGNNIYGNNAKLGKDIYFTDKSIITLEESLNNNLSIYMKNLKPYEETGRTGFGATTIAISDNMASDAKYIKLENEGLKATSVLNDGFISAYKGTKYNIKYNLNGGTAKNPSTYTCVDNVVFNDAVKPGYTFLGWKEVETQAQLLATTDEEYVEEIATGTLGDKEYEAVYTATTGDSTTFTYTSSYDTSAFNLTWYTSNLDVINPTSMVSGETVMFAFDVECKNGRTIGGMTLDVYNGSTYYIQDEEPFDTGLDSPQYRVYWQIPSEVITSVTVRVEITTEGSGLTNSGGGDDTTGDLAVTYNVVYDSEHIDNFTWLYAPSTISYKMSMNSYQSKAQWHVEAKSGYEIIDENIEFLSKGSGEYGYDEILYSGGTWVNNTAGYSAMTSAYNELVPTSSDGLVITVTIKTQAVSEGNVSFTYLNKYPSDILYNSAPGAVNKGSTINIGFSYMSGMWGYYNETALYEAKYASIKFYAGTLSREDAINNIAISTPSNAVLDEVWLSSSTGVYSYNWTVPYKTSNITVVITPIETPVVHYSNRCTTNFSYYMDSGVQSYTRLTNIGYGAPLRMIGNIPNLVIKDGYELKNIEIRYVDAEDNVVIKTYDYYDPSLYIDLTNSGDMYVSYTVKTLKAIDTTYLVGVDDSSVVFTGPSIAYEQFWSEESQMYLIRYYFFFSRMKVSAPGYDYRIYLNSDGGSFIWGSDYLTYIDESNGYEYTGGFYEDVIYEYDNLYTFFQLSLVVDQYNNYIASEYVVTGTNEEIEYPENYYYVSITDYDLSQDLYNVYFDFSSLRPKYAEGGALPVEKVIIHADIDLIGEYTGNEVGWNEVESSYLSYAFSYTGNPSSVQFLCYGEPTRIIIEYVCNEGEESEYLQVKFVGPDGEITDGSISANYSYSGSWENDGYQDIYVVGIDFNGGSFTGVSEDRVGSVMVEMYDSNGTRVYDQLSLSGTTGWIYGSDDYETINNYHYNGLPTTSITVSAPQGYFVSGEFGYVLLTFYIDTTYEEVRTTDLSSLIDFSVTNSSVSLSDITTTYKFSLYNEKGTTLYLDFTQGEIYHNDAALDKSKITGVDISLGENSHAGGNATENGWRYENDHYIYTGMPNDLYELWFYWYDSSEQITVTFYTTEEFALPRYNASYTINSSVSESSYNKPILNYTFNESNYNYTLLFSEFEGITTTSGDSVNITAVKLCFESIDEIYASGWSVEYDVTLGNYWYWCVSTYEGMPPEDFAWMAEYAYVEIIFYVEDNASLYTIDYEIVGAPEENYNVPDLMRLHTEYDAESDGDTLTVYFSNFSYLTYKANNSRVDIQYIEFDLVWNGLCGYELSDLNMELISNEYDSELGEIDTYRLYDVSENYELFIFSGGAPHIGINNVTVYLNGNGVSYNTSNGSYAVAHAGSNINNLIAIEIASEYDGLPVKQISGFNETKIIKVVIPSSVEVIQNETFLFCYNLTTINIPSSVIKIGLYAFGGCSSLTDVTIDNSTGWTYTNHDSGATGKVDTLTAYGLTTTYLPCYLNIDATANLIFTLVNNQYYKVKAKDTSITSAIIPATYKSLPVREIEANGFKDCTSLTTVTIPNSITKIGNYAFSGCTGLLTLNYNGSVADGSIGDENYIFANVGKTNKSLIVNIGDNVTVIPSYMFCTIYSSRSNIAHIKKVVFGANSALQTIGTAAFRYADVYEINLENCNNLTTISTDAFRGCQKLAHIYIPKNVTNLGQYSFGWCPQLVSMTWDAINCTTYNHNAFSKNNNATDKISVSFGSNVEYIPDYFDYNSADDTIYYFDITNLDLTGLNVKSIGSQAFYQNTSITTVKLNEGLQNIGMYAFYYCSGISGTLTIDVATIGKDAFYKCTNITGLIFGDNVITISNAFESCKNIATVSIGKNVTTIDFYFNNLSNLTSISVDNENTNFVMDDGVLYSYDKTTLICYPRYKSDTSFVIPNSVTAVGAHAVSSNKNLTSLTISENVESIGGSAFGGLNYLTELKYNAINNKSSDSYYTYDYLGISSTGVHLIIGDSVEVIPERFMDIIGATSKFSYKITALTIGKNVKTIGMNAFAGHTTIKTINYNATNLTSHGGAVFGGTGATGSVVNIGNNVESIPAGLFDYDAGSVVIKKQNKFSKVNIPASVKEIGADAFKNCSALTIARFENTSNWYVYNNNTAAQAVTFTSSNGATLLKSTYSSYTWINAEELPDLKYTLVENGDDDYYRVSAFDTTITTVEIPSTFNGLEVREIAESAFAGCTELTSIVIPNTIKKISVGAFSLCSSLTEINIPASVTHIDSGAFYESGISAINVDSANESYSSLDGVLFDKDKTELLKYPTCKSGSSYTVPEGVVTIADYAFEYCGLNEITLPSTLRQIGICIFNGCSVTSVNFGENYQNWIYANNGFSGGSFVDLNAYDLRNPTRAAKALTETYVNNYLYKDDYYAYDFVAQYTDSKLTHYYVKAKDNLIKWIYNANIPAEYKGKPVTGIMDSGFIDRPNIKSITIPSTITYIGNYAFSGCTGIEFICYDAINCENLNVYNNVFTNAGTSKGGINVIIGKEVKVIPNYLFCPTADASSEQVGLPKIVSVEFAEDNELTTIGEYAFRYLKQLKTINLEDCANLTSIGTFAFRGDEFLTTITIPENVTYLGESAFGWMTRLETIVFNATNVADLESASYSIFAAAGQTNVGSGGSLEVIIGNNVKRIPAYMFGAPQDYSASITSVSAFSNNLEAIGAYAFENCDLCDFNSQVINAEYIGNRAFANVDTFTELNIGKDVKFIDAYAFAELNNLSVINFNAENVDNEGYLNISDETILDAYYAGMEGEGYSREEFGIINPQLLRGVGAANHIFDNAGVLSGNLVLNIGADVVNVPAYMFNTSIGGNSYPRIKSINWENATNVKTIGQSAFRWLNDLTEITIPESLEYMGGFAFYECMNVTTVNFLATNMNDMESHGYDDHEKLWHLGNYAFHNLGKYNLTEEVGEDGETTLFTGPGVTVNIGANVERVPAHTFHSTKSIYPYAPRITTINWGDSNVTEIGEYAFHNCGYLTSITIPENVTTIGNYAFANAYHARSLTIKSYKLEGLKEENNIFASLGGKIVNLNDTTVSGECILTFDFLTGDYSGWLTNYYKIPDNLMYCSVGSRARITKVTFAQEEQKFMDVGDNAFRGCYCLVTVEGRDKENASPGYEGNIGSYAFYECKSLKYGDNGEHFVTGKFSDIHEHAFEFCNALEIVDIVAANIGNSAFRTCLGLTSITYLSDYTHYIGNNAFRWCINVTSLRIESHWGNPSGYDSYSPDANTDNYIFFGLGTNTDGVDVTFKGPRLGDNFFYSSVEQGNAAKIKSLTLIGVEEIGTNALRNVHELAELTIPETVTSIGKNAFYGMKGVKILNYNATRVNTIAGYDVSNPNHNTIEKRDEIAGLFAYLGNKDFNYETLENGVTVNFGASVEYIPSYLFLYSGYSSAEEPTPKITAVNFECELTGNAIGNRAFDKLLFLKEIAIPNGVTHIYEYTFYYCLNLEEVSLPTSLQHIGQFAFGKCNKLATINLDMDSLTYIGKESFRETAIKEIVIPKNVETIADMAFYQSGIEKLTIPEDSALNKIGNDAFAYSTIKELYINCDIETLGWAIFASCHNLDKVILKNLSHTGTSMFAESENIRYFEALDLNKIAEWTFAYAGGYYDEENFVRVLETLLLDSPSDWYITYNENYTGGELVGWTDDESVADYLIGMGDSGGYFYKMEIFDYVLMNNNTPNDASDDYYAVKAGKDIGAVTDLVLPTEYRGLPVLRVAEPTEHEGGRWYGVFEGYKNFKTITIPKQYKEISSNAFIYCDNVTDIYYNAEDCSVSLGSFGSLNAKMHIGEDVLVLPAYLLSNGYNQNCIQPDGSIYYDGDYFEKSNITEIIFAENCKVTKIEKCAFAFATELKSLTIPESVKVIEKGIFQDWSGYLEGYGNGENYKLESVKFESPKYWYIKTYKDIWDSTPDTTELMDYETVQDSAGMVEYFITTNTYSFEKGTPAYEITLNHGEGTNEGLDKVYYEKYGELGWFTDEDCSSSITAITKPTPSDDGNQFAGYYTAENGEGTLVINADGSFVEEVSITEDTTLYAYYEYVASYIVALNHGSAVSTTNTVYYHKDGSGWYSDRGCTNKITSIEIPDPNVEGYIFQGYYTAETEGTMIIDENGAFVSDVVIEANIEIYAQYKLSKVKYTPNSTSNPTYYIASAMNEDIDGEIIILAEYNGLPVTEIAEDGFYNCVTVTSITIPESITTIGSYAFMGMTALEEVNYEAVNASGSIRGIFNNAGTTGNGITFNITDTVERIPGFLLDTSSSSYDINVKVLNIGKNVKAIGVDAFYARDTIEVINYNAINCETITQSTYGGPFRETGVTDALVVNIGEDVTHIPSHFFSRDRSEGDYQGADEVSNLKVVNMGSNVISIGYSAFNNSNLQEIDLETATKLETIGEYAFADCDISTITIPESVKKINNGAFASLSLTVVNYNATNCEDNTEPSIVETSAFGSWSNHSSIFDVTHIGTLNIADNVEHIPAYLFYVNRTSKDLNTNDYSYRTISTINIGTGLKTIGTGAFARATRRTTTININATNLTSGALDAAGGNYGFITTSYATNVTFADNVTNIPASLLEAGNLANVIIGSGITSIGDYAFGAASINSIVFKDSTKITYIGDGAFKNNLGMTGGTFIGSSALTYVGEDAFFSMDGGNELEMDLSACVNLNTIGARAFYGCRKLTKITIAEGVTSIGYLTFFNCTGLIEINFNAINCADLKTSLDYNYGYSPFAGINNVNPITLNIGDKVKRFPANFTYGRYQGDEFTASYVYASTKIETINFADNSVCTTIGDRAFINSGVTTINWGANSKIETIGAWAIGRDPYSDFGINPNYLESLTLPETLKTVGDSAFDYQNQVTELTVPESVESIGHYAFSMTGLTKIYFNAINCTGNFKGLSQELELVVGENVTKIDNYFLVYSPSEDWYENNITKITFLGNNLISIGKYAFSGAQKLTEITLPNGLQTIADHAFYNNHFTTITIPASVYQIGAWALHDVYTLKSATFEITTGWTRGSKYYPGNAYKAISSTSMANATTAAGYLHDGDPLKREVPEFITTIVSDSESNTIDFGSNEKITLTATVSAEETATYQWYRNGEIVEGATSETFEHTDTTCLPGTYAYTCMATVAGKSAESISITITVNVGNVVYTPDNAETPTYYIASASSKDIEGEVNIVNEYNGLPVTHIAENGFAACRKITSVTIPENITTIGRNGFNTCTALTSIAIPENVTSIEDHAFENCYGLTEINFNAINCDNFATSYPAFAYAGRDTDGATVTFGSKVTRIPACLFYAIDSSDGVTTYYTHLANIKVVNLGKGIQTIGGRAFEYCANLTTINIPDDNSLKEIDYKAFYGCKNLINIDLGKFERLETIGSNAFYDCQDLDVITIPKNVKTIGKDAFSHLFNVSELNFDANVTTFDRLFDDTYIDVLNIGDNVTYIPQGLFCEAGGGNIYSPNITTINIGKGVEIIDRNAFWDLETLTTVNIAEDSVLKEIRMQAFDGCAALTTINIPASVTKIGKLAFRQTGLTSVTMGKIDGWYYTSNSEYKDGTAILSEKFSTASAAATSLKSTYTSYYLYREVADFTTTIVSDSESNTVKYDSADTITMSASVSVSGEAPTYQWYRNGEIVEGAINATFVHSGITCEVGSYTYTCMATIGGKSAESDSITITVTKGDLTIKMFSGDVEFENISMNNGETISVIAKLMTQGNVLGTVITVEANKDGASYLAGAIESNQSVISITAGDSYVKDIIVTVSYAGDDNYNATTATFTLNVQGVITLATNGYGTLTHEDAVDNKVIINEDGTVSGITASANANYGLYYYTVVGKTIDTVVYNTNNSEFSLTGGSFDLTNITESVTITAYFMPVINLNFVVTGGELVDYNNLLNNTSCTDESSGQFINIKHTYNTSTAEGIVGTASAMFDSSLIYEFAGTAKTSDNTTSAIKSLKVGGEFEVLMNPAVSITGVNGLCYLSSLLESITLEAGETYTVEYTLVSYVSVDEIVEHGYEEFENEIVSIIPNTNGKSVTIDGKTYVETGKEVNIEVKISNEDYIFVGYKMADGSTYVVNDKTQEENILIDGENGVYSGAVKMNNETAGMKPIVLKKYKGEITVNMTTSAQLALEHTTTGLKYNLSNDSVSSNTSIDATMLYGDYILTGSSGVDITITITYSDKTSKTISPVNGIYEFNIEDVDGVSVTNIDIVVKAKES